MLTVEEFQAAVGKLRVWPFRDPRGRCPHCRAWLGDNRAVVVAARHCPHCGGRVLADPPDPRAEFDEPPELPPDPEFRAAADRHQATVGTVAAVGMWAWLVGMVTGLAVIFGAGTGVRWLDVGLAAWSCVGPPLAALGVGWFFHRRARHNELLACRWCGELLTALRPAASATGNCTSCGRPVVEPPAAAAPAAGPLYTVGQFAARVAARRRAATRAWVLFAVLAAVLTAPAVVPPVVWGRFETEIRLTRLVGEGRAFRLMQWLPIAWAVGGLVASAIAARAYFACKARRHPLTCPHCGKPFTFPGLVLASRRCDQCHARAFAEPEEG